MRTAILVFVLSTVGSLAIAQAPAGDAVSVRGVVSVAHKTKGPIDQADVAIWLRPLTETGRRIEEGARPRLKMVQHHRRFAPHVLIAPVGSMVEFPNLDPFFHNVFSLFDGKRFDLGLYESGDSRGVSISKPGISYVFCNIHPEMSAVIIAVDTPYSALTNRAGQFTVPNVPPGRYLLSVWHERYKPEHPNEFPRELMVSGAGTLLEPIRLIESGDIIPPHKNKYGQDYIQPRPQSPAY